MSSLMGTQNFFVGYTGQVWQSAYIALDYYLVQMKAAQAVGNPAQVAALSETVLDTLYNAMEAIHAYNYATSWQTTATLLQSVSLLPLPSVDPTSAIFFDNRMNAYVNAASALAAIVPQPPFQVPAATLPNGVPSIPDCGLLNFYSGFSFETVPAGLTAVNFVSNAQQMSAAFTTVANSIRILEGIYVTQYYDIADQQAQIANIVTNLVNGFTSGPIAAPASTNAWNQIVALSSMTMSAGAATSYPNSQANQQSGVILYALGNVIQSINKFLFTLGVPNTSTVSLYTINQNDTPMSIAAAQLGNFELWTQIVALNNLSPPWITQSGGNGTAAWGQKIFLPSPGSSRSTIGASPSNSQNVLGTDIYIGPTNGSMPAWMGDFQTITGLQNLAYALGRRVQTPISRLIYDVTYGSRIPSQIGMIQDAETAGQIRAFLSSSLLSDPRVQEVVATSLAVSGTNVVSVQGVVHPIGDQTATINMNEVVIGTGGPS